MPRYRTEFIIPPDRMVCVQLPAHLPEGRATITVYVAESADTPESTPGRPEHPDAPDHEDIEWWDEFDPEEGDESREINSAG